MSLIDLRSDTVTKPDAAMRAAMAEASVGDDQYGDDPTTNLLQERVASLLGKEAALFVASGTMANQVALKVLTTPGDEVIVPQESHIVWHETGAAAVNSGVQFSAIGEGGVFDAACVQRALKPRGHIVFPPTTLVVIENTHNRGGGIIFPQPEVEAIAKVARKADLSLYLDGARLFNTAVASGHSLASLAAPFDLVSVALSKGLGCPFGSVLAGSRENISAAIRIRRMFGGALRQSGILAAAGIYALDHNIERLAEDHENAKFLASEIEKIPSFTFDPATVQTNMVVFNIPEGVEDAYRFAERAKAKGLLISPFAARTIRLATHLNVDRAACQRGAEILADLSRQWA